MKIKVSDLGYIMETLELVGAQTVDIRQSNTKTGMHFEFDDKSGNPCDVKVYEASVNMNGNANTSMPLSEFLSKLRNGKKDAKNKKD